MEEKDAVPEPQSRERQLERIVEHSAPVVLDLDLDGQIRFASGYHLSHLGLTPTRLIDTKFSEFVSLHEPTLLALQAALAGEFATAKIRIADRHFDLRLTPMLNAAECISGVTAVFSYVTVRSASSTELSRSEASFRSLIESSPDAIIVHKLGRIVYVNEASRSLLHYENVADLVGQPAIELFSKVDRPTVMQRVHNAISGSKSFHDRFRLIRRSGEEGTFEVSTMEVQYLGGKATVHVARDITQSLRMQTKLAQTERLTSLGTLAGGVGHEINNPLAYMTANLSYLVEELTRLLPPSDSEDNAELHHALRDVQDGTGRVKDIVRQLNEFSRVDSEIEAMIDPRSAIESAIRMSWNHVRRSARLHTFLQPVASVRGNFSRLGQVFLAVLLNASEALIDQHISDSVISISCRKEADHVLIEVRDNGPGIPDEILCNIFDPFYSAREGGAGTGLGLSVAHSIISEMGGHIDIATKLGEGTTVQIQLPRAQALIEQAKGDKRILVVTDDVRLLEAVQIALRGNKIAIAGKMSIASPELKGERLDAILCDVSSADVDIGQFGDRAKALGRVLLWFSQQLDQLSDEHKDLAALCLPKPVGADTISMQLGKLWPVQ